MSIFFSSSTEGTIAGVLEQTVIIDSVDGLLILILLQVLEVVASVDSESSLALNVQSLRRPSIDPFSWTNFKFLST